jgi:aldose sugar dehydrogenase
MADGDRHFRLNADRTHLEVPQSLSSRSLASSGLPKPEPIIFGEGFGGISNLVVSPDGYLYVVSVGTGNIYRIESANTSKTISTNATSSSMSTRIVSNTNNVAAIVQKNLTAVSIEPDAADLGDKAFNPSIVDIKMGYTIVWTNNDPVIHTIVEGSPSSTSVPANGFNSEFLNQGMTFKHTFDKSGIFNYYCSIHPTMIGKVVVVSSH